MAEKKRAMISQPMWARTNEEILWKRNEIKERLEGLGYEVVDSFLTEEWVSENTNGVRSKSLWFLAKSLEIMSHCDTVYFCDGWQQARGCRIEHEAAIAYGLEIYEEIKFSNGRKIVISDASKEEIDDFIKRTYGKCCGGHPDPAGPAGEEGKPGVKIPVISMEDVPKIMEKMQNE